MGVIQVLFVTPSCTEFFVQYYALISAPKIRVSSPVKDHLGWTLAWYIHTHIWDWMCPLQSSQNSATLSLIQTHSNLLILRVSTSVITLKMEVMCQHSFWMYFTFEQNRIFTQHMELCLWSCLLSPSVWILNEHFISRLHHQPALAFAFKWRLLDIASHILNN